MSDDKRKRGRPKGSTKDITRHNMFGLCLTDSELNLLNNLSLTLDKSRPDIMREALTIYASLVNANGKSVIVEKGSV